ncbi:MAG TPA: membrane protein insertion efficiency factor YidD [Clostridia bacterium]|nr:membrane protein insertion efficiency factor YidD [Clostridia bacterium]
MKRICRALILFYKKVFSPIIGRDCIYTPTCSMYTLDAIYKYGVLVGSAMGAARILRCNPFAKGGFDPVKENFRGNAKWTL